jgi:hypothetical protein
MIVMIVAIVAMVAAKPTAADRLLGSMHDDAPQALACTRPTQRLPVPPLKTYIEGCVLLGGMPDVYCQHLHAPQRTHAQDSCE